MARGEEVLPIMVVIFGGVMNGSWNLATKDSAPSYLTATKGSGWQWENVWLVFTVMHVVLNIIVVLSFVDFQTLGDVYRAAQLWQIVCMCLFSLLWGLGGIGFGVAIKTMGIAVGTSLQFWHPYDARLSDQARLHDVHMFRTAEVLMG
eukprot:8221428-Pyramimonas_sp.AAC.1